MVGTVSFLNVQLLLSKYISRGNICKQHVYYYNSLSALGHENN